MLKFISTLSVKFARYLFYSESSFFGSRRLTTLCLKGGLIILLKFIFTLSVKFARYLFLFYSEFPFGTDKGGFCFYLSLLSSCILSRDYLYMTKG